MGILLITNLIKGIIEYKKEEYIIKEESNETWYFIGDNWW
jgi:hypothetical protein